MLRPRAAVPEGSREEWTAAVAPEGLELREDRIVFPEGELLPLTVREGRLPGDPGRPLARLQAGELLGGFPAFYSVALRREPPDIARQALRARRTLLEGVLLALAEKTGRRPSMAEQAADVALDRAESAVQMGAPAFRAALVLALFAPHGELAERIRRDLEARLRAMGLLPQRFLYVPERALLHLQPGGPFFHGLEEARLVADEALGLLPEPDRPVLPADDAVWIGFHARSGRDVFYSFTRGFDPAAPPPSHATLLILGDKGTGKTTLLRLVFLQRWLQGRTIVVLDPEGENVPLCQALGGTVVAVRPAMGEDRCLLHPLSGETPQDLLLSARALLSALGEVSPAGVAALDEAIRRRLARRPGPMRLIHLVEALQALEDSAEARRLAGALRPYAAGGGLDGYFDRERPALPERLPPGSWIHIDVSALSQTDRNLVYAALSTFFYRAVTVGETPVDLYADEGWRMLRSGPLADLLDEVDRRARKRGGAVVLATHLPEDLAKGRAFGMAATAFMGRLPPESARAYLESAGMPEAEAARMAGAIARLGRALFMAVSGGGREASFPVEVAVPPAWLELFRQTDPFARMREG